MSFFELCYVSAYDRENLVCEITYDDGELDFMVEISCETGKSVDMQIYTGGSDVKIRGVDAIEFSRLLQKGIKRISMNLDSEKHKYE